MPINVFRNSNSNDNGNKIDTSLFVQKHCLRTKYIVINIDEDIDLSNQFRNRNLPKSISIQEPVSKNYVDYKFSDPSIKKTPLTLTLAIKISILFVFFKVNSIPTFAVQLTPKIIDDQAISDGVDEPLLLRLDLNGKLKLDEQDSIVLNCFNITENDNGNTY